MVCGTSSAVHCPRQLLGLWRSVGVQGLHLRSGRELVGTQSIKQKLVGKPPLAALIQS